MRHCHRVHSSLHASLWLGLRVSFQARYPFPMVAQITLLFTLQNSEGSLLIAWPSGQFFIDFSFWGIKKSHWICSLQVIPDIFQSNAKSCATSPATGKGTQSCTLLLGSSPGTLWLATIVCLQPGPVTIFPWIPSYFLDLSSSSLPGFY